jgi:uncharacterized membrane protein
MMEASLLIWLHLVAAVSWIGGMVFLSVVLVPILRREPFASQKTLFFLATARRFRVVVWGVIAVLLFTGPLLLHQRGIPIADPSRWPTILVVKLGLVTILLFLTFTHDLIIGPRVGRIIRAPTESRTRFDHALVLWSRWIARFSLLPALAVLFAAVMIAAELGAWFIWSISSFWFVSFVWLNQTNRMNQLNQTNQMNLSLCGRWLERHMLLLPSVS